MAESFRCPECGLFQPSSLAGCPACREVGGLDVESSPTRDAPSEPKPARVGTRIAERYLVLAEIGQGGFGIVVRALDQRLGRTVAIKLLGEIAETSSKDRERFEREALILASLDHPNIVPIYDVGVDGGRPFFAMKFVRGRSLAARIRTGPLEERDAVAVLVELAKALEHAHARGVLHRDLKPSNVLEDDEGRVYLADFGISRAGFLPSLTLRGTVMGTLEYLSPEALGGEAGVASDLYSLGAILHEMLFGRPCFIADDPRRLVRRICDEPPPLLACPPLPVSPPILGLLSALLEKDPAKRPASAMVVRQAVEPLLTAMGVSGGPGGPAALPEAP